jgi:uncharacterized membrane protein
LALNLFLIGGLVAFMFMRHHHMPMEMMRPPFMMGMAERLSDADAAKLRAIYADTQAQFDKNFEATHAAMQKLRDVLAADPVDSAQLDAALAAMKAADQERSQVMDAVVRRAATELSPEGRRDLLAFGPPRMMGFGSMPAPTAAAPPAAMSPPSPDTAQPMSPEGVEIPQPAPQESPPSSPNPDSK